MRLPAGRARGAAVGIVADLILGEPPAAMHPVAGFGSVMRSAERALYGDSRLRGTVHAAVGVGLAAGAVPAGPAGVARLARLARGVGGSTAAATWLAVAGRTLGVAAGEVEAALGRDDLAEACRLLPALVGRSTEGMDEKDVARAVVESVAENTVDAVVAPALWGALAGGPGALAYRAVNTLDAMVGHHSPRYERYGWASARLDDAAAWVPARVTAALVAALRPAAAGAIWRSVRTDAPAHPSPNSGVAEAAFAAALGLRLGGANRYGDRLELRPPLGDGRPPEPPDIARAVRLSRDVSLALAALLSVWPVRVGRRGRR